MFLDLLSEHTCQKSYEKSIPQQAVCTVRESKCVVYGLLADKLAFLFSVYFEYV